MIGNAEDADWYKKRRNTCRQLRFCSRGALAQSLGAVSPREHLDDKLFRISWAIRK